MDVAAFLPSVLLAHLRVVLGPEHTIYPVEGWDELEFLVRRSSVDVAVVDPSADGLVRVSEIRSLVERYPTLPMVLYTSLSPQTLKASSSGQELLLSQNPKFGTRPRVERRPD